MAFLRKRSKPAAKAEQAVDAAAAVASPSPNPATNLLLADIALRGGGTLLKRVIQAGLLGATGAGKGVGKDMAKDIVKGRTLGQSLFGMVITRVATRSVPGALLVGGGLLAKTLYDRRHAASAVRKGKEKLARQADRGRR